IKKDIGILEKRGDRAIKMTEMGSLTRAKSIRIANYTQDGNQKSVKEYEEYQVRFDKLEADLKTRMYTEKQKALFEQIMANDKHMNSLFTNEIVPKKIQGDIEALPQLSI